jgi:putative flippase GtrA
MVKTLLALVPQLSRYSLVSIAAMTCDWALFLLLVNGRMMPTLAGVLAYTAGLLLHYVLSVRLVFDVAATGKPQARLLAEFALSGLAGMAVTGGIIAAAVAGAGIGPVPAKLCAVVASFMVVYSIRRTIVFAVPAQATRSA